ncbi:MAG: glycosyltransferase [Clostridiales bacterium]|jgi:processive 1,2-diacylglycerol beta-glucosyltransferase|nr:glycosyltransferase [Clostridiales bacterium]
MINKKIMILTSYYTGRGHASITQAIESELKKLGADYLVVEAVDLCGKIVQKRCKKYGIITSKKPWLWKIAYNFSNKHKYIVNKIIKRSCKKKFLIKLKENKPDIILTVHPMFVGSILDILKKDFEGKFFTLIADLVSINSMWFDKRSHLTFCPTCECYQLAKNGGLKESNLEPCKLPTRQSITEMAKTDLDKNKTYPQFNKCLIMSGGEGSGNMDCIIENVLLAKNTTVTAICGKNNILCTKLQQKYFGNERVTICGFIQNMHEVLSQHDIAIVRGSPNVLMECINLTVPIIVTSVLPGQEKDNDTWIEKNGLGLKCPNPSNIPQTIEKYLLDNKTLLYQTKQNQRDYRELDAAKKIVDTIFNL